MGKRSISIDTRVDSRCKIPGGIWAHYNLPFNIRHLTMSSRKKQMIKTEPAEEARYIKREEDTDSDLLIKDEESTEASGDQPEADSSN